MHEILFKGFHHDERETEKVFVDGEWIKGFWVYGYYVKAELLNKNGYEYFIIEEHANGTEYNVIEETVCQYTGLKDKNGNMIFEGHIVRCYDRSNRYEFYAIVEFGNPNGRYDWGYQLKCINGESPDNDILLWVEMEAAGAFIEIVGSVHSNPELLEVGE